MSNPTSNFGWQMPTNTDLVTNLPADFAVFGQAVDTSMADLLGGTTGQILAKATGTNMDFVWIANDQGDITGVTAGTGITVTSPTGPVPTVSIDTAVTVDKTTAQTLTNKTLTSPVLTTPSISNINAKGDILVGTADNTLGIITAGSNGETLVADSAQTTGLAWAGNYAAGKNRIINGNFGINQRAFTSTATTGIYTFDRFLTRITGDGTATYTPQVFTPGAAPVVGYEGTNYIQIVTASQTTAAVRTALRQNIEDVRTFAGQTVTLSFFAKASSGTPKIAGLLSQNFGGGGSAAVDSPMGSATISTSWARYSLTIAIPSISGKTIGTSSFLLCDLGVSAGSDNATPYSSIGIQNNTFSIWGVQVEAGSVATAFQIASGGSQQAELAMCQRYYYQNSGIYWYGTATNTSVAGQNISHPVQMRATPTVTTTNLTAANFPATASSVLNGNALTFTQARTASGTGGGSFGDSYTASIEL